MYSMMHFYRAYLRCWALLLAFVGAVVYTFWESWWGGAVFGILLSASFGIGRELVDVAKWIKAFDIAASHLTPGDKL